MRPPSRMSPVTAGFYYRFARGLLSIFMRRAFVGFQGFSSDFDAEGHAGDYDAAVAILDITLPSMVDVRPDIS